MLEIYMTRHGETEWNKMEYMQGHGNSPLTDIGIKQGASLGKRLKDKGIHYIYTSPIGRAKETTEMINSYLNCEVIEDERLKEINIGHWQGMTLTEIRKQYPTQYDDFLNNPERFQSEGMENFLELKTRAGAFVEDLLRKHGDEKVLVVSHAVAIKAILNYVAGNSIEQIWNGKEIYPTSLTKLNVINDRISIVYMSDTSHYSDDEE